MRSAFMLFLAIASVSFAQEPNWIERERQLYKEDVAAFTQPQVGTRLAVMRRIGGEWSGELSSISPEHITIERITFSPSDLTPESSRAIFPASVCLEKARSQVAIEKAAYIQVEQRKQAIANAKSIELAEQKAAMERARAEEEAALEAQARQQEAAQAAVIGTTVFGIGLGLFILLCVAGLIFNFIPSFVAFTRGHPNAIPIFLVNLLLGLTGIGWIIALVWSFTAIPQSGLGGSGARPSSNGSHPRQSPRRQIRLVKRT